MLDPKILTNEPDRVRAAIRAKGMPEALEALEAYLLADEERRVLRQDLEAKQAQRNAEAKRIGEAKRRGEDAAELMRASATVSEEVKRLEEHDRSLKERMDALALELPNLPHESVPFGESEHDNVVVHERGERAAAGTARPHWETLDRNGWLDLDAGVTVTGSGFPVFRGAGAKLVRALSRFFLDRLEAAGYLEVQVPLLVNAASATATGQLPDKEGQMYRVEDGYYLVPTSEVAIANLHRDEILDANALPLRYCAFTPCFRREAGSHGKDVRGLNRVHQFDKVEMVAFTAPEDSYDALEAMTALAEGLLEDLALPYRRLLMCSGDMGFTQAKKYDLEAWSPGQDRWLEVSSISNVTDFQARRLRTRARPGGVGAKGRPEPVHTLNGSALALPRTLAALVETHADADGRLHLPEALRPYLGVDVLA